MTETQTGTQMSGFEPRRDRLPQWHPRGCAGMSARSATAALGAGSCIWRPSISAVSNPSFSSSPWMRGAPHKGPLLCVPTTPSVLITRPNRQTSAAMIALFCLCLSLFASPIKSKS